MDTCEVQLSFTCDLHSFLIGAGVSGAGHDHSDCRAVLLPHGGIGRQFSIHSVYNHLIQVTLQQRQQHLEEKNVMFFFFFKPVLVFNESQ